MQGILSGGEYLDITKGGGRVVSFYISKRNRILKTRDTDCVSIAAIHHLAIFHIAYRNPTFTNNFYF